MQTITLQISDELSDRLAELAEAHDRPVESLAVNLLEDATSVRTAGRPVEDQEGGR